MAKKFIQKALAKPGAKGGLHRSLGVPAGKKIGAQKIAQAAKKPGKVGKQARFAQTLARLRKS